MNLPNKLTILRMALVPFFVFFTLADFIPHHLLIAGLIFGAASYTDHLDGKIARRDNLITNFGKLMDPLADKIMVMSALVCFVDTGFANVWFVLLIMIREFAVTSIRCTLVSLLRIISCMACCSSGYPVYPISVANRTTVDSLTPTVAPSRDAVIKATRS